MNLRAQLYLDFASRFAANGMNGPAKPSDPADLDRVETALETLLPVSYREFLSFHGPLFVPKLWDSIVERELSVHPLREFFDPNEVISTTLAYWAAGMPEDTVGVAGDFMGNLFCFPREPNGDGRPTDSRVMLFDHEYCRVESVASSFDAWLTWYLANV